jgi:DNA-binding transcriptional regulator YiaG
MKRKRSERKEYEAAERNLKLARDRLFTQYLARLKDSYMSVSVDGQTNLLGKLEDIVQKLDDTVSNSPIFNSIVAKELRIRSGLTQEELAKRVGVDSTYIVHWEKGKRIPTPFNKSSEVTINEGTMGYLTWLKNQGYDPFKLD